MDREHPIPCVRTGCDKSPWRTVILSEAKDLARHGSADEILRFAEDDGLKDRPHSLPPRTPGVRVS